MALITWILMKAGVAPSAEDFARMDRAFRERGHHVTLDFGTNTRGWTRWTDDNWLKRATVGLGYDYYIDRRYHGVGFEVIGQSLGKILKPDHEINAFFLGGGLGYYPIRSVRVFTQAGAEIGLNGQTEVVGRAGMGYRFMFFKLAMQPYFYVQETSAKRPGWSFQFRFEY
jgi:hypothetical protein